MRWAFSSESAAWTACSSSSSAAPSPARRGAASRAAAAAAAGAGGGGRRAELDAERGEDAVVEVVLALQERLDPLQEAPDSAPWMMRWS